MILIGFGDFRASLRVVAQNAITSRHLRLLSRILHRAGHGDRQDGPVKPRFSVLEASLRRAQRTSGR